VDNHRKSAGKSLEQITMNVGKAVAELTKELNKMVESQVKATTESAEKHQKCVEETLKRVSSPLDTAAVSYLEGLKEGLGSLNNVLGSLGEKQIVIRKESWWRGLLRGKEE
jgi:exonuclease VII large subunit